MEYLAIADADKIHEYVFAPHELKLIRGGSRIQRELNEAAGKMAGESGRRKIFAGGGTTLASCPNPTSAEEFCAGVERLYLDNTRVATVTTATQEYPDPEKFADSHDLLRRKLEQAKRARTGAQFNGGSPFWVFCQACGRYPASGESAPPAPKPICEACRLREAKGGRGPGEPEDFEEIGRAARPQDYLAIVYIDVDRLGKYLNRWAKTEARYEKLSQAIDRAVVSSVENACQSIRYGAGETPPQRLLVGGDDAVVALAAQQAIPFLREFRFSFDHSPILEGCERPTFSAGVVLAHSHFPIAEFMRLAEDAVRSAKRVKDKHSVDYEIVTASMAGSLIEQRERGEGRRRTWKPYALDEFLELTDGVARLKRTAPASKLRALYGIAQQGPMQAELDYLFLLSRLPVSDRNVLRKIVGPRLWQPKANTAEATKAADLAELWEFVNGSDAED